MVKMNNGRDYIISEQSDYLDCVYIELIYNDDGQIINVNYDELDRFIALLIKQSSKCLRGDSDKIIKIEYSKISMLGKKEIEYVIGYLDEKNIEIDYTNQAPKPYSYIQSRLPNVLAPSETRDLFKQLVVARQNNDTKAISEVTKKIVEGNLRLAFSFSYKWAICYKMDFDCVFSNACIGLSNAVNGFDITKDVQFSTYAVHSITREVFDGMARECGFPRTLYGNYLEYRKLKSADMSVYDVIHQMEKEGSITKSQAKHLITLININNYSLYSEFDIPTDDNTEEIIEGIYKKELEEALKSRLGGILSKQAVEILIHKYGLFGNKPKTFVEIAKKLGITYQSVSDEHERALKRLKITSISQFDPSAIDDKYRRN